MTAAQRSVIRNAPKRTSSKKPSQKKSPMRVNRDLGRMWIIVDAAGILADPMYYDSEADAQLEKDMQVDMARYEPEEDDVKAWRIVNLEKFLNKQYAFQRRR